MLIAVLGAAVALILGTVVGFAAATLGRWVDMVLMRAVDALLAFPSMLLLILAAAVFTPGPTTLVLLLGLTSWMGLARLVRGQVLSIRERPFVLAARVSGTPWYRMWTWHYLPGVRSPGRAGRRPPSRATSYLAEATLSFLGLGLPVTTPTWGYLVNEGHRVMLDAWWLATLAGSRDRLTRDLVRSDRGRHPGAGTFPKLTAIGSAVRRLDGKTATQENRGRYSCRKAVKP